MLQRHSEKTKMFQVMNKMRPMMQIMVEISPIRAGKLCYYCLMPPKQYSKTRNKLICETYFTWTRSFPCSARKTKNNISNL